MSETNYETWVKTMTKTHLTRPLSIELTEELHEGARMLKVTFFERGLDVNMLRFDSLETMLQSVRGFLLQQGTWTNSV
mgnify:CR=1 FL=1